MRTGTNELIERLISGRRIKALVAPAGFGKTRLLELLAERLTEADNRKTIYVDRITHDEDSHLAEHYLTQATVDKNSRDRFVLIDDADRCDPRSMAATLDKICAQNNAPLIILAMRTPDAVPLSSLVLSGSAELFDMRIFRLSNDEKREILVHIPRQWSDRVSKLSGTWPAAARLLAVWAADAEGLSEDWQDEEILLHSGLHSYISEEIIPDFTDNEYQLLCHISLFDRPDAPILEKLLRNRPVAAILRQLHYKFNGLVLRDGRAILLHPAIRCFLHSAFLEKRDQRVDKKIVMAADESANIGNLAEAARLAVIAKRPALIDHYVAQHRNLRIWVIFGYQTVRAIVEAAGPNIIAEYPRLQLMSAIVHLKEGRISDAEQLYHDLEESAGDHPDLATDLEVLRVTLMVYGCGLERKNELETMADIVGGGEEDPAWLSLLSTLSCIFHSQHARFDRARKSLTEARVQARLASSEYNLMFSFMHETAICLGQGQMKQARVKLADARKVWRQQFIDDEGADTVISALSASVEFETGRLTHARNFLSKSARRLPHSEAWFDIYVAAYEPMARLLVADRGIDDAMAELNRHQRELIEQGLPRVAKMLAGLVDCLSGQQLLNGFEQQQPPSKTKHIVKPTATWQEQEIFTLANAYLDLETGKLPQAIAAIQVAIDRATKLQLVRSELRFRLIASVLYLENSEAEAGEKELMLSLTIGSATGQKQAFRELGSKAQLKLLRSLLSQDRITSGMQRAFAAEIISKQLNKQDNKNLILTQREQEVISALAEGGSDKILARQLEITEHGIRYHLKNIYRKLSVHDRLSAVSAARSANLI